MARTAGLELADAPTPLPSDLASLRVPTDVRLSPDGQQACFVVKEAAPDQAGYRMALWLVPADGSAAAPPADPGRPAGRRSALEPGRPLAGLPLRPWRRAAGRRRAP